MRVLILGGSGMLGHKLAQVVGSAAETIIALRGDASGWPQSIRADQVIGGVDVRDSARVDDLLDTCKPDAVLNAAGVIKHIMGTHDPAETVAMNALFPQLLARSCDKRGIRLIHYSTDCVYTGSADSTRGPYGYRESDPADARDLYGMTKLLGEPTCGPSLVLRTSIIGRELRGRKSLLEWFLAQDSNTVSGFTKALFTGLTTLELANVTVMLLRDHPDLRGLWNVAAPPIDKFTLLELVKASYQRATEINRQEDFYCDRRLDGSRLTQATGWQAPPWPVMIQAMHDDPLDYGRLAVDGH